MAGKIKPLLVEKFIEKFRAPPTWIIDAPGRVNLIGEHTDYHDGFVLPMAIDRSVQIALRSRPDSRVIIHALDYDQSSEFPLDTLEKGTGWAEYIKGAAWAIKERGLKLTGWDGVMIGDVPRGAGLSSSSAVTQASILAFAAASNLADERKQFDPVQAAMLGHQVEDGWMGVHVGIMDQMVCMLSKPGHALFLDCRTMNTEHIPMPGEIAVAILDTSTRRGLVDSEYNMRRSQCDQAAKIIGVPALRDATDDDLRIHVDQLDSIIFRRARHVIYENGRVLQAVAALRSGDVKTLGRLLKESHASLRDDFEVSNEALDVISEVACQQPGCFGARMTGAGFGGCAIAILEKEQGEQFSAAVSKGYHQRTGLNASIYLCQPAAGASIARLTI